MIRLTPTPSRAPTTTSSVEWMPACTRLWATRTAMKRPIAEIGRAYAVWVPNTVTATQPAKATAAWTDGMPP